VEKAGGFDLFITTLPVELPVSLGNIKKLEVVLLSLND